MEGAIGNRLKQSWKSNVSFQVSVLFLSMVSLAAVLAPWLPFSYSPNALDLTQTFQAPFSDTRSKPPHWLGTDQLGRDVFSNLVYGFHSALRIAFPVIILAIATGVTAGALAGFYGNRKLQLSFGRLSGFCVWVFLLGFYFVYIGVVPDNRLPEETGYIFTKSLIALKWLSGISVFAWLVTFLLSRFSFFRRKRPLPVDEIVLKIIEVVSSVPRLLLILVMAALVTPGAGNVILLLSLTFWSGPARLVRAEVLKIKQLPYIEAAQAAGLTNFRILTRQILPNISGAILTAFCFGLSNLLSLEATLSFLGIGLPPEMPGWGRMMAAIRLDFAAWWLLFFPALTLILTIMAIQNCGNVVQKAFLNK